MNNRRKNEPEAFAEFAACMVTVKDTKQMLVCEFARARDDAPPLTAGLCPLVHDSFELWPADKQRPCLDGVAALATSNAALHEELVQCDVEPPAPTVPLGYADARLAARAHQHACVAAVMMQRVAGMAAPAPESMIPECDAALKVQSACYEQIFPDAAGSRDARLRRVAATYSDKTSPPDRRARTAAACAKTLVRGAAAVLEGCSL